ncbi:MAG: alpha-1,4-glucan--maltose-1-phosphate maltosyltransferase [Actinomycetes bacterium]
MAPTRARVVFQRVWPSVDGGQRPAVRSVGELVEVAATVLCDSHEELAAELRWRSGTRGRWRTVPMQHVGGDRVQGAFVPDAVGPHQFEVVAWVASVATWQRDLAAKRAAGVAAEIDLQVGAELVAELLPQARSDDATRLEGIRATLLDTSQPRSARVDVGCGPELTELAGRTDPKLHASESGRFPLRVDRERARFSTWYELFPRSCSPIPGEHGTLGDVIGQLDRIAELGFDVLYLPPIHPIGTVHRKGRNNATTAAPGDPGSPWAIGSAEGGHHDIHPELGTRDDLRALVAALDERGMELAMDIAFQCAPDHPWVAEHPEWFRQRPDGSIQYAENPPKKYQDIYPLNFETPDPEGLWEALHGVFEDWIGEGVRIFRVDNPHTKSFAFWEWCAARLAADHPDVVLLAEAFTRQTVMTELARRGFHQSYTYFAWKQHRYELEEYYRELFHTEVAEVLRPNSWPNTPDILTDQLASGKRSVYLQRLVLAGTLTANYGIYGPPFELMDSAQRPGAEEYLDNEKYELKRWDLDRSDSLAPVIGRVNAIRHAHPALQQDRGFQVHHVEDDALFAYSKRDPRTGDVVLCVVNLDPDHTRAGWTWLDTGALGLADHDTFDVEDLLGGDTYRWHGPRNFVQLDPHRMPAHVFAVHRV